MITMDELAGVDDPAETNFEPQQLPLERWDDARMMAALLEQDDLHQDIDELRRDRREMLAANKADLQELLDQIEDLQGQIRSQRTAR